MAIVIEQEKRQINWFAFAVVGIIVIIIGAAVYYSFFINPEVAEIVVPNQLKILPQIVKIKLDFNEFNNDPAIKRLKPYISPITTGQTYKANPFSH